MLSHLADLLDFAAEQIDRMSILIRMVDEELPKWQRALHR